MVHLEEFIIMNKLVKSSSTTCWMNRNQWINESFNGFNKWNRTFIRSDADNQLRIYVYFKQNTKHYNTVERIWCFSLLKNESKLNFCWFWSFWFDETNISWHQLRDWDTERLSHVTSDHFLLVSSCDHTDSDKICNKLKCKTQLGTEAAPSRTCGESLKSNWANNYRSVSIHATTLSDRWLLWSV